MRLDATLVAPQPAPMIEHRAATPSALPDPRRVLPLLKAVADERRLRILTLLSVGHCSVAELHSALEIGQSLLSFHLRTLKDVGLVSDRRDGRSVYYALVPNALEEVESFIHEMRSSRVVSG